MDFEKINMLLPKTMREIKERCDMDKEQAFQRYEAERYWINFRKRHKEGEGKE
ncbi:MAG: hypothetical protein HOJ35_08280 [Bdellovibrionales bacterium]|nr:hypothetical protein [Bdellovibrionales bacterium]